METTLQMKFNQLHLLNPNSNGTGTPASVNGSVALNQKTLNQMRAMGAAKGTLRTGIITGKANSAKEALG
jgi:hypothetical protein